MLRRHIPNAITLLNLLCGCIAILSIMNDAPVWAACLIGLAALFDFLDGMAARLLKVTSATGKELDSLADMVSFGVAPAFIMYLLLHETTAEVQHDHVSLIPYLAFLIALFSALRLARFNTDTRQTESFIGLPTPANALFIASIALLYGHNHLPGIIDNPAVLVTVAIVFSALLVAPLPLFSLKFKSLAFKGNATRYLFLAGCALLLGVMGMNAIPLTIIYYILLSVLSGWVCKASARP